MNKQMNQIDRMKALKNGKGIQYLLNEAREILGNPVLVHDMDYKMIACTENIETDDPIWNEFVTTGTVSRERIEFYKNENFFDAAANAKKITYLISEKLKYDRILCKLFNRDNIQIGIAVIEAAFQPFSNDIIENFGYFCDILNKEIARSEYYSNYGQAYQETLINKLIEGDIEDKKIYTAHVESIYANLKTHLYLLVADIVKNDPTYAKLPYFRDLFKSIQPTFKYSIYQNHIIIIVSLDNTLLDPQKELRDFNKVFEQNQLYAGISSCFENVFELSKYYREAVHALNDGLESPGRRCVFQYNEVKDQSTE